MSTAFDIRPLVRHQTGNVIEWHYAEPLPPGEDGTPQSVDEDLFFPIFIPLGIVVLAVWIYYLVKAWRAMP